MMLEQIRKLLAEGEGLTVEFKECADQLSTGVFETCVLRLQRAIVPVKKSHFHGNIRAAVPVSVSHPFRF